jgi:LuxR family quorum-sensing system transcriptional regulator CciR
MSYHAPLSDDLKRIRIGSGRGIRAAAEAYRDIVMNLCEMRVAASHNIATNVPMMDEQGQKLAQSVFGWSEKATWNSPNIALESPIGVMVRYSGEPFWVNKNGMHAQFSNSFTRSFDVTRFEQRARTKAALVVPVHMPFSVIGAVSYTPVDDKQTDLSYEYAEYGDILGIFARAFVRSYVLNQPASQLVPNEPKLTRREVQCLRWAAMGKTDVEIGMIIGRSQATVRFHVRNAGTKLDAVNRSQAVFKATQLGYITRDI